MEEKIELSEITKEICRRFEEYKVNIKKDMVIGDDFIIEGVELVTSMIKEINPQVIDDVLINYLDFLISNYQRKKENRMQIINKYTMYGIQIAYNIVFFYVQLNKSKVKGRTINKKQYL